MFTSFAKTQQDMLTLSQDYFKMIPKDVKEVKTAFQKAQTAFATEKSKFTKTMETYKKAGTGDASANELAAANKASQELMTTACFASYIAIPGAIFTVPAMAKLAEANNVKFVPESVSSAFGI